ncbi:MAG: ATP-binding protein [Phascolarctobacterium sp.]|nr:ATP-binding protein [Phascolarctobacterium sp.]
MRKTLQVFCLWYIIDKEVSRVRMVERIEYLERLIAFKDKQVIKIITGIRRCGKSTLLEMFQTYLLGSGVDEEQIIAINFEDYDFIDLVEPKNLYAYIKERLLPHKRMYLFFDEIQHVKDFQRVVDSLYIKKDIDIYITGSNAHMLSGELATLLSGRYVEISMLPLSFKEYVSATGEANLMKAYREYTESSSFPYALELRDDFKILQDYLRGIYSTIVLKDIMQRNKIVEPMMLESMLRFVFDNIGNQLSTKKIADTMTSEGRKIDIRTVERYLTAFMESYVVYEAKRYNIKGKQYLKTLEKYYAVDVGLRTMLLGKRGFDAGRILENIVYLELLRRGYDVYVGKVGDMEVDFVAMNRDGLVYYQVAATVRDENTLKRELKSLQAINDSYPKIILTLDEDPEADYDGIRRMSALDWLVQ